MGSVRSGLLALAVSTACALTVGAYVAGDPAQWWNWAWTAAAASALVGTLAARSRATGRERAAWTCFAAAAACWVLGQLCWNYYTYAGFPPGPTPADLFWFGFVPFAGAGLWRLLLDPEREHTGISALEMVPVVLAAGALATALLTEAVDASTLGTAATATALAYPLLYVTLPVLMAQAVVAGGVRVVRSPGLTLLFAGFLFEAIAFGVWAEELLRARYVPGTTVLDPLWVAGMVCIGLGAAAYRGYERRPQRERLPSGFLPAVTFMVLVCAVAFMAVADQPLAARLVLLAGVLAAGVALMVRSALQRRAAAAAYDALAAERAASARFFGISQDLLCTIGFDGTLHQLNPAWAETLGWLPEELEGRPVEDLVHPGDRAYVERLLAGTRGVLELRVRSRGGAYRTCEWASRASAPESRVYARATDVTDRRRAREELAAAHAELEHRAMHDPLTGLPNRGLLYDRLRRALSRTARDGLEVALYFVDLDGFKAINDRGGHAEGDRVLSQLGVVLSQAVRPHDTVARFGGDEFAVLCEIGPDEAAEAIGRRIVDAVGVSGTGVGASVGLAVARGLELAPDTLLARADAAMYAAKRGGGRQCVRWSTALDAHAEREARPDAPADVLFRGAFDGAAVAMALVDARSLRVERVNERFEALLGVARDELVGRGADAVLGDAASLRAAAEALAARRERTVALRHEVPVPGHDALRLALSATLVGGHLLLQVAEAPHECRITLDAAWRVRGWSDAAERLFGYPAGEALGRGAGELIVPERFRGDPRSDLAAAAAGPPLERTMRRRDGSEFHARLDVAAGGDGTFAVVVRDVSDRVRAREAETLCREVVETTHDGVWVVDSELRTTFVNDQMARMLGYEVDERLGTHPWEHGEAGELRGHVQRAFEGERELVDLRLRRRDGSIAWFRASTSPHTDPRGRIAGALAVLSEVDGPATARPREGDWVRRVRAALHDGRLELHSQPIVDIATGRMVYEELLLRLREGDRLVSAGEFLPDVELSKTMFDVDCWVISRALRLAAEGRRVQLNLSARSVGRADVLAHVERTLRHTGAAPGDVAFEITETAVIEEPERARRFAERLASLGCHFVVDDFGTGYAGLSLLRRLPISRLKIDREFVSGVAHDERDRRLVANLVALARDFEQETIAEGVEDEATLEALRALGVDRAQGYLLGRPAPTSAGSRSVRPRRSRALRGAKPSQSLLK